MKYIEVNFTIQPLHPARDILIAELAGLNFESFVDTENGLQAYVPFPEYSLMEMKQLSVLNNDEFQIDWEVIEHPDENWNKVWESSFEPIAVGSKCYVRAPFHEEQAGFDHQILIEPKMSFGTGHHDTTWQMIDVLASQDVAEKAVLDMGCGTGVLAILASKMGASEVLAVDIDDWAYENTVENLKHNNNPDIEVLKGGAAVLAERSFHLILANINKNVLVQDMPEYIKALYPGGKLLFSGFFDTDVQDIIDAAEANGLRYLNRTVKNNWATVLCTKNE